MAITYPRNLPNVPIATSRFGLNVNQAVFESGLSRKVTVQSHAGGLTDRWEGVYTTPDLTPSQIQEISAWMVSLNGREKNFYAYDLDRRMPSGVASSASSAPFVNGASQTGKSLITDGWAVSTSGLLNPGDFVQIGTGFHMILEQVDSDASGNATLNFEPAMRVSPADDAPIIFENPKLVARLGQLIEGWETGANKTGNMSFTWEEVL